MCVCVRVLQLSLLVAGNYMIVHVQRTLSSSHAPFLPQVCSVEREVRVCVCVCVCVPSLDVA